MLLVQQWSTHWPKHSADTWIRSPYIPWTTWTSLLLIYEYSLIFCNSGIQIYQGIRKVFIVICAICMCANGTIVTDIFVGSVYLFELITFITYIHSIGFSLLSTIKLHTQFAISNMTLPTPSGICNCIIRMLVHIALC
jgi:hypothetical protein